MRSALLLLAATACSSITFEAPPPVGERVDLWVPDAASTVVKSNLSGFRDPTRVLVADSVSWASAWLEIVGSLTPRPARPAVDFEAQRVVVLALGREGVLLSSITLDSVVSHVSGSIAYFTTVSPGGCLFHTGLSLPVHVVRAPVFPEPIYFRERAQVLKC